MGILAMRHNMFMLSSSNHLGRLLLPAEEVLAQEMPGQQEAAVLIPMYTNGNGELNIVFTKRKADLRRHGGEVSFPGGRPDDGEHDLRVTALREAEEEIGLAAASVDLIGALPPTTTFVTNYAIYPFVGIISDKPSFLPNPNEVERVLEYSLGQLIAGHERKRLVRKGIPVKTDTFTMKDGFIWGATARITAELLGRLSPVIEAEPGQDCQAIFSA